MKFYGYKKCSTCRNAHRYLREHGLDLPFHDLVEQPPTEEELREWVRLRGEGILPFVNTKGTRYRELGLQEKSLSTEEWLSLLSQDGKLLKRPILVLTDGVILGFDQPAYERLVQQTR